MSKHHNYSQYSNNKNHDDRITTTADILADDQSNVTVVVEPEISGTNSIPETAAIPEIDLVTETVDTVTLPETVEGVVVGCTKLNVRANHDTSADVVCVLDVAAEIKINVEKSTDEWFYVCTAAGIEGYCMRKFVTANL